MGFVRGDPQHNPRNPRNPRSHVHTFGPPEGQKVQRARGPWAPPKAHKPTPWPRAIPPPPPPPGYEREGQGEVARGPWAPPAPDSDALQVACPPPPPALWYNEGMLGPRLSVVKMLRIDKGGGGTWKGRCGNPGALAVQGGREQGCIGGEGASEAAPAAVRQAVGGGCRSGWGRLLSVANAIEAGTWRWGDSGWA